MHLLSVFSLRNRALIALITIVVGVFGGLALTHPQAGAHPLDRVPAARRRHDLPRRLARGRQQRRLDADRDGDPGRPRARVARPRPEHRRTRRSSGVVHLRHRPRDRRAEDHAGDQPHQVASCPTASTRRCITGSIDDFPVIQLAVTELPRRPQTIAGAARGDRSSPTLEDARRASATRSSSAASASASPSRPTTAALAAAGFTQQAIRDALDAERRAAPGRRRSPRTTRPSPCRPARRSPRSTTSRRCRSCRRRRAVPGRSVTIARCRDRRDRRRPGHRHLARRRRARAHDRRHQDARRQHRRRCRSACATLLPELEEALGGNTKFTVVFDQAPFIEQSIEASPRGPARPRLRRASSSWCSCCRCARRSSPRSRSRRRVLITFIGMQASGYSLNILTLGALTIAIGRVVDDSIVVIENIKRHITLGERQAGRRS